MKVGKRVLFLSENSQKVEKGILFGRPLKYAKVCSSDSIDVEIIFCHLYRQDFIRFKKGPCNSTVILFLVWEAFLWEVNVSPEKGGVFRPQDFRGLTKKGLVFRPKVSEKGLFFILENADTSYYSTIHICVGVPGGRPACSPHIQQAPSAAANFCGKSYLRSFWILQH